MRRKRAFTPSFRCSLFTVAGLVAYATLLSLSPGQRTRMLTDAGLALIVAILVIYGAVWVMFAYAEACRGRPVGSRRGALNIKIGR